MSNLQYLILTGITIPTGMKEEKCLVEIEKMLRLNGKSLADYPPMPMPSELCSYDLAEQLISTELSFDKEDNARKAVQMKSQLTLEQLNISNNITPCINSNSPGFFFMVTEAHERHFCGIY